PCISLSSRGSIPSTAHTRGGNQPMTPDMARGVAESRHTFLLLMAAALLAAAPGSAKGEKAHDPYAKAQGIIADMQRIVTPQGIQESFNVRIGGIDQWISVRGKDRENPILLFVHGGPAAPALPVSWA